VHVGVAMAVVQVNRLSEVNSDAFTVELCLVVMVVAKVTRTNQ